MWFIRTSKVGTDAFRQLTSRKQAIQFHDVALGMHPFGFNRVEPGALGRQQEGQDPHAVARLLDRSVVSTDPGAHGLALMPGGVIPDQEPMGLALLQQAFAAPVQELGGEGADGPSGHEAQPDLRAVRVLRGPLLPENPIAGQGLGIRVVLAPGLLYQPYGMVLTLPGMRLRQSEPTPPDFISKAD